MLGRSPGDYRESFDLAREAGALDNTVVKQLKPSVGRRNAIVHEHVNIAYSIVASAVPVAIETYSAYRRQVAAFTVARTGEARRR